MLRLSVTGRSWVSPPSCGPENPPGWLACESVSVLRDRATPPGPSRGGRTLFLWDALYLKPCSARTFPVQEGQQRQRTTQGASDWQPSPKLSSPRPKVGSATEEGRRKVRVQKDGAQFLTRHAPGQQVRARAAAAAVTVRGREGPPADQFREPPTGTPGTSQAMQVAHITSHCNPNTNADDLIATRKRSTRLQQPRWLAASTVFRARVVPQGGMARPQSSRRSGSVSTVTVVGTERLLACAGNWRQTCFQVEAALGATSLADAESAERLTYLRAVPIVFDDRRRSSLTAAPLVDKSSEPSACVGSSRANPMENERTMGKE